MEKERYEVQQKLQKHISSIKCLRMYPYNYILGNVRYTIHFSQTNSVMICNQSYAVELQFSIFVETTQYTNRKKQYNSYEYQSFYAVTPLNVLHSSLSPTYILYFVDRASRHKFLLITNLMHFFMYLFIHFISTSFKHQVLIIRRSNFINTSSGMISLCK